MPNRKSSNPKNPTLDELAHLLATSSTDSCRMEAGCKQLRLRMSRKLGVPFYDTEDIAQDAITSFLEEVRKSPGNEKIVNGAYLWVIARNRFNDRLRAQPPSAEVPLDALEDHTLEGLWFDECQRIHDEKQGAMSLQLMAYGVLRRQAAKARSVLGKDLTRILDVVHLVASHASSPRAALSTAAAVLVEEGVLTQRTTRNLRKRLHLQPELRRELPMAIQPSKTTKPKSSPDE